MYYRARFYDTELGRFLTKDPLTGGPDDPRICYKTNIYSFFDRVITENINSLDPHNTNRYVYCRNNPINFTDPLGLWAWDNDLVQKGIGGMLGFYGKESAKAGWGHVAETAKRSSPIGQIVNAKENAQATIAQTKSRYETQRGGGAGKTEAAINTGLMAVNNVGTNIVEAISGTSLTDGSRLTGIDRGSKALIAIGQVAATAAVAGKGIDVVKGNVPKTGYHATKPEYGPSIEKGGLRPSTKGRMGGGGSYVSSTSKGAIAEYNHYNPSGPTPSVYQGKYRPGRNYTINPTPKSHTTGNIPLAADTLTTKSVRSPGTLNTIIRNNSLKKLKKIN